VAFKRSALQALERGLGNPRHAIEAHVQRLDGLSERLDVSLRTGLERRSQTVATWGARLRHPLQQVQDMRRHLESQGRALDAGFRRTVDAAHSRFQRWGDLLESYSYRGVLKRGFALVTDATGHAIGSAGEAKPGEGIAIEFHDGKVAATVDGAPAKPKPAKPPEPKAGSQGQLF
jgi:exodeoxyribonuclease VII large subunit